MSSASLPRTAAAAVVASLFASVLVVHGHEGTQASAQPGPVRTKGPCRTYDTSVTSVTSGGGMQVTVEISGVFDPWSLRMVQNVTYTSNQGAHFSYVQTSTWDSPEDFIAEVIRLKPPALLPSNPTGPAPVNDIIPPLTRSKSTVASGQIGLTKTNAFDSTNRLTGFSTRTPGGTIRVNYSAWDSLGRPTAGTMQGPANTSTQTIGYDDKALTQTESTTTRGITAVMTTAYDQNGNPRTTTSSVTRGAGSTTIWTPHSSATICLGDMRSPTPPPVKPAGPNPMGTFSGTIGGQSWSAAIGVHADRTGNIVSVGGSDKRYVVSIGVSAGNGPGEYRAGSLVNEDLSNAGSFTSMTAADFKALIDRNSVVATVFDTQTKQSWQASPTLGSGTVNLASAAGAAAGTFSLTLDPVPGTGASGSISFNGAFNIKF